MGASKPFVLLLFSSAVLSISIENNAYKDIYISSSGSWSEQNLKKLKEVLTKSSEYLFHATRNRSYFGEFVIADTWCNISPSADPRRVDVYVEDKQTTTLRTQHSKGCGETGELMYMPLSWLTQRDTAELAREFVQQWSIFRYGVFEEDPIDMGSCYKSKDSWNPVGCYDRKKVAKFSPEFEKGLPFCSIDLNDTSSFVHSKSSLMFTSSFVHSKSSLMFTSNFSKAMDFCDGSPSFPHDPAMPTLHNSLCDGEATWSVIQNSQDFKYGRNKPLMELPPSPTFACIYQNDMRLTFAIQNNTSSEDLTEAVTEIAYSLYQNLLGMKDSSKKIEVNFVTFSEKEDDIEPLKLDLPSGNLTVMLNYVKTFRDVSSNCLSCGFRKALDASKGKGPFSTIVVIAWEHTIADEPPSEVLKVIQSAGSRIHLVLVENTEADVLSAELIDAIRSTGGQIFLLPKKLVSMASSMHVVLSTILKSPLQVEDDNDVVHEADFENITGSFTDSFTTINPEKGTLEYLIHCHPLKRIVPTMQNCVHTSSTIDTYKCVEELEPDKIKVWEFKHTDDGGTKLPNCSSVAILHNTLSTSREKLTLKGWLSNYAIEPGSKVLIVYAEIIGSSADYRVMAEISGPDDFLLSIELRDNGNGDPDIKQGDGIFSRYFMPPSLKKGSYGVKIFAESKSEITDKFYTHESRKSVKIRRQSKSIGFFSVTKSFPEEDIFPPSRVGDLRAVLYDQDNSTVTLQWTAPGNDYDNGTATSYEIKYSLYASSLSDLYFNSEENMEPTTSERDFTPGKSGTMEKTEIVLSACDGPICYIALRAKDANNNQGRISNIIQIYIDVTKSTSTHHQTSTEMTKFDTSSTTESVTTALPTENPETSTPVGDEEDEIFDKKFIITVATAAGILLLIIFINIIVCCRCVKKHPEKTSRNCQRAPPYNVNIAYQNDSPDEENDRDVSVATVGNPSVYLERPRHNPQYAYHTSKSLTGKSRNNGAPPLGFQLVETMPTTRSLSRFKRRLNDSNSESDSSEGKPTPAPQQAPDDRRIYSLGIV